MAVIEVDPRGTGKGCPRCGHVAQAIETGISSDAKPAILRVMPPSEPR